MTLIRVPGGASQTASKHLSRNFVVCASCYVKGRFIVLRVVWNAIAKVRTAKTELNKVEC